MKQEFVEELEKTNKWDKYAKDIKEKFEEKENKFKCEFSAFPSETLEKGIKPEDQASAEVFYLNDPNKKIIEEEKGLLPLKDKEKEAFISLRNLYNAFDKVY